MITLFVHTDSSPDPENRGREPSNVLTTSNESQTSGIDNANILPEIPPPPRVNGTIPDFNHGLSIFSH